MEDPFLYGITLGLINAKCPFNWRKHTRIDNCSDESSETFYDYDSRQVVICKEQWEAKLDCKFPFSHVTHTIRASVRHVKIRRPYVTSCPSTMKWFGGQFLIQRIRKNNSRALESAGTSQKTRSKFLTPNFDHFFWLVPALSSARKLFFLILRIKNYPQNHSIVLWHVVTYPTKTTCRTLEVGKFNRN